MERRVLFAILLSFVVLYGYQALVVKPKPAGAPDASGNASTPGNPASAVRPATPVSSDSALSPGQPSTAEVGSPGSRPAPSPRAATPLVADTKERDIRVETHDVVATFTNRGALLKSWRLKHYFDQSRQPQELIDPLPNQTLPFTLRTPDAEANAVINAALYTVSGEPAGPADSPVDLRFEYRDSSGLAVVKEFHLDPALYILAFRGTVVNGAKGDRTLPATILWGPAMGDAATGSSYAQKPQGLIVENSKVQRLSAKDIAKQATYEGDFRYAGVDDNYFMTVALAPGPVKITYQPISIPGPNPKDPPRELVAYGLDRLEGAQQAGQSLQGAQGSQSSPGGPIKFFIGPKDFDVLAQIGPDMTRAINFGMFSVIVVPLLRSLKWVNSYIGNYGWSIVALTAIIQIILFPLQHKSIVSMRKMQEVQPQVKAIQDRYAKYKATDPEKQKMNQELMALYKERGVNPASGCVPIILTMPLLLAMWAMLQTSIELRGAPFLWVHDLTVRDPLFIAPVLMGLTQFWQQRITPAAGADPAQQKMMMFMPAVMTVMFISLPAGALVYYTVSNLLRIGQQYVTNSIIGPPNVRAARPPAERRVKRVGAGKTDAAASDKG